MPVWKGPVGFTRTLMNLRKIAIAAALSAVLAAPAESASAQEVLENFGLMGRWAIDCEASPSSKNGIRDTEVSVGGEVSWTEDHGPGTIPNHYRVIDAVRLNA